MDKAVTVVFFDREDVLLAPPLPAGAAAVALSPSALFAAREAGIAVQGTIPAFSRQGHEKCVAAAGAALRDFDGAAASAGLPPSVALMARQSLWGHASLVHRLHETLPPGPWRVRNRSGAWVEADDWAALHHAMLPRIWSYGQAHFIAGARPPWPWLYAWLSSTSVRVASGLGGKWVAAPSPKLKNGLRQALKNEGATIAVFQPTKGAWNDYADLFREHQNRGPARTFAIPPLHPDAPRVRQVLATLEAIGQALGDEKVRSAWKLYQPYFAQVIPVMLAITARGGELMRMLAAPSATSYEANSWISASLMEAAGNAGAARVIFNHNSNPPSESPTAAAVLDVLFSQRTCNRLVDVAALWSPVTGKREFHGMARKYDVRLAYPTAPKRRQPGEPLRILHAGNYQNWSDFFPWIAETADEYMDGLSALADAVEQLDGVELTIRVRPKREVDSQVVLSRLGHRRNVVVCGVEQEFLEQLADSDLLVAHFSTTVEQALQMGKHVLLWGSADRYTQFPAQEAPPAGTLNDSVYAVRDAAALPAMLAGIRDAMRASGDGERPAAAYAFDAATPGVAQLASFLINPIAPTEAVHP
ncbi:hypothetical protein PMI15_00040 [Polaromonas sp. CF318]|nr:hypothetical protein PMI15_00040 [Polaromonas sp. CF318]